MYIIKRINYHDTVQFTQVKPNINKPIFSFYRYVVYPTRVFTQYIDPAIKETVFLAVNANQSEQVIIYLTQERQSKKITIKYLRSKEMDREIAWLLVQGFIHEHLAGILPIHKRLPPHG